MSGDLERQAAGLRALLAAMDATPAASTPATPLSAAEILARAMSREPGGTPHRPLIAYATIMCEECGVTREIPRDAVRWSGRVCGSVCAGDALERARELLADAAALLAAMAGDDPIAVADARECARAWTIPPVLIFRE